MEQGSTDPASVSGQRRGEAIAQGATAALDGPTFLEPGSSRTPTRLAALLERERPDDRTGNGVCPPAADRRMQEALRTTTRLDQERRVFGK